MSTFPTSKTEMNTRLEKAWEYRNAYVQTHRLSMFCLVHGDADRLPGLRVDLYGSTFRILLKDPYWQKYSSVLKDLLSQLFLKIGNEKGVSFDMCSNFGVSEKNSEMHLPLSRIFTEEEIAYEIHFNEGLHTGIFLDQRENRKLIRSFSSQKKVLNLFSYTGAFTLAALKGGASEVHSVDLSKKYLFWLQRNLKLNQFDVLQAPTHALDVFEFLKKAKTRQEKFDLIIIDPPTFSRGKGGKKGTFSTEKDLDSLVGLAAELLADEGRMFISVNTQKMNGDQFAQKIKTVLEPRGLKILKRLELPPDFRLSPSEKQNPYLKACWVG